MASEATQIFIDLVARDKASKTLLKNAATLSVIGLAAVKFAKDSVKAYSESEDAVNKLNFAYQKFPKLADVSVQSLDDLSQALQRKTVFDDEATKSSEATLAQFNLTGKQIEQLIPLVQDYAAATGQDLQSATVSIGKAFEGNAKALKSIGINFHATGNTAKDFATIQDDLNKKVGGFAEKQGKTASGQLKILENQYNDLQEVVGSALVPALEKLVEIVTPLVEHFNDLPGPVKEVVVGAGALAVIALVLAPRLLAVVHLLEEMGVTGTEAAGGLAATAEGATAVETTTRGANVAVTGLVAGLGKITGALAIVTTALTLINEKTHWFDAPTKGVQELATNSDVLAKTLTNSIPDIQSWGDHFIKAQENVAHVLTQSTSDTDAARESLAAYDKYLAGLAKDQLPAAAMAWDRIVQVGTDAGATIGELKSQFPELTNALGLNKSATDDVTGSINKQTHSYQDVQKAINSYIGVLESSRDKALAVKQTNYDALVGLKDLGKQHKITADDAVQAWNLERAAAQAAADNVQGAANKNKAYRDELVRLRDHLKKGSPLWNSLNAYIGQLKSIPKSEATQVFLNFQILGYNRVVAAGQALANAARAAGTAGGRIASYDTGGTVPGPTGAPRLAIVHGGEKITPVGASAAANAGGGVTNIYQFPPGTAFLADERTVKAWIRQAQASTNARGT